jgi:large subunit ribosomal protein L9
MGSQQVLLIEDVDDLGRSGDVVAVKPGYARNFLIPQKRGVVADARTLRMQARLKEERAKRAEVDRAEAEALSATLNGKALQITVKVDPEGHMYGSVSALDILRLFEQEGVHLEKRSVALPQPIRSLGVHELTLKLKEGVLCRYTLTVESDHPLPPQKEQPTESAQE